MSKDMQLDMEAAEWLVTLEDEDTDLRDARLQKSFFDWLRRSPRHLKAFLDSADAFRALDAVDSQRSIEVRTLIDDRLADVVPLRSEAQRRSEARLLPKSWTKRPSAAVAAVVMLAMSALLFLTQESDKYATKVGEQRTFKLDDGSVLHLNTQSRAEVEFSRQERKVRLLRGEALFVVERDAQRPFMVEADGIEIRALGTQFNVYRHEHMTTVSVVEGLVQVGAVRLRVGEVATVTAGQVKRLKSNAATSVDAIAWRARRLVFRDTPLAEVAAEFNRYNKTQIHVEGSTARDKQLTAIFSADHPQSLILYVQKDPSLAIARSGDSVSIRAR